MYSIVTFSQEYQIPEIDFHGETENQNVYVNLLKIKDPQALFLKIEHSDHAKFIVFLNNGKIRQFEVITSNGIGKKKIRQNRVKSKHYKFYWEFLYNSLNNDRFIIQKEELNKNDKSIGNRQALTLEVSDGTNYSLELTQDKKFLAYSTYEPEAYIKNKVNGFQERQKLMNLISDINKLIKKY